VWLLCTVAGYLWWNLSYVQHQGRYLFPAIVPIGLGVTVGLREVYTRPPRVLLPIVGAMVAILAALGLWRGDVPWFCVALAAGIGGAVWLTPRLEARWPGSVLALTYAALAALTILALPIYVIPYLTP